MVDAMDSNMTTNPSAGSDPILRLRDQLRQFAAERDWDQYHSPKNLAAALSVEAAELLEPFQWLSEEQSRSLPPESLEQVTQELADVFLYLIRLADRLNVDLAAAAARKIELNARKYPVDKSRGSAAKYTDL
jgi:NTP pyrophosphatase (non-canonical NTP hydrolase)